MRILLTLLVSMTFLSPKAQSHLPIGIGGSGFTQWSPFAPSFLPDSGPLNQHPLNHQWFLRPYASLSAGYLFLNGGSSYLSAPVGLMLFHPLTNNVSAFAGVSAAPVVFSLNGAYINPGLHSSYPGNAFSGPYGLGLNARVEGGLMYMNDAKTFSISGSIGIERGGYPVYPSDRTSVRKQ